MANKGSIRGRVGAAKVRVVRVGQQAAEKAKAAAAAAQKRYAAAKAKLSGKGMAIEHGIASLAGAALTGALRGMDAELLGIDAEIIAAGAAIGAGVMLPVGPRIGGDLIVLGAGALGPAASDMVEGLVGGDGGEE